MNEINIYEFMNEYLCKKNVYILVREKAKILEYNSVVHYGGVSEKKRDFTKLSFTQI